MEKAFHHFTATRVGVPPSSFSSSQSPKLFTVTWSVRSSSDSACFIPQVTGQATWSSVIRSATPTRHKPFHSTEIARIPGRISRAQRPHRVEGVSSLSTVQERLAQVRREAQCRRQGMQPPFHRIRAAALEVWFRDHGRYSPTIPKRTASCERYGNCGIVEFRPCHIFVTLIEPGIDVTIIRRLIRPIH